MTERIISTGVQEIDFDAVATDSALGIQEGTHLEKCALDATDKMIKGLPWDERHPGTEALRQRGRVRFTAELILLEEES